MVFRVNKTKDYTTMSNHHLRNKELSLKAKGLLSVMLSLPPNWDYSIAGLVSICKENEPSVKSALNELKQLGYLTVKKMMPNETKSGRIEYEYNVYEIPQVKGKQEIEKQGLEKQGVVIQQVENIGQLNTNILSKDNKVLNNEIKSIEENKSNRFVKPTVEEIEQHINEKGYDINAQYFFDYYEAVNWYRGKTKIKDWKKVLATWNSNNKKNNPTNHDGDEFDEFEAIWNGK